MSEGTATNGRHIYVGEPELYLSLGAVSLADARSKGFQHYEGVDQLAINIETDVKTKERACRGLRQPVKTSNQKFLLKYQTTLGNLGVTELGLLYHSSGMAGSTVRAALANVAGTAFNFDTGASGIDYPLGKAMQLLDANGNAVHDLGAVTVTGGNAVYGAAQDSTSLAEGIDYDVDLKLGFITFRNVIDDDVITVNLTAAEITKDVVSGYLQKITPGTRFTHKGYGQVYAFDGDDEQDAVAFKHLDFQFEMTATSGPTLGDGEFGTAEVDITVLNPNKSSIFARPNLDLWGGVLG